MKETHPIPYPPVPSLALSPLYVQATALVRFLRSKGHVAFFAGGAVRDMVLQRAVQDIDIATDASTKELLLLFPRAIQVGVQFGVIRVIQKGHEFEIATFRSDGNYEDGRHPSFVKEGRSYQEDAERRDFTINGLFYDPVEECIFDCVNGLADIEKKIIRTIGSAQDRFQEDKLRVIRAVRFSHVLSCRIDEGTKEAMRAFAPLVPQYVSGERIWDELSKMHTKGVLPDALRSMYEIGLFEATFPFGLSKNELERRLQLFEPLPATLSLFLAALWYDRKDFPTYMKERFHASNKDFLAATHFHLLLSGFSAEVPEREFVRLLALEYSAETLPFVARLVSKEPNLWYATIQKQKEALLPWIEQQKSGYFSVMGHDLIRKGVKPGKEMGKLLEEAFSLSLQTRELDTEALLARLVPGGEKHEAV